MSKRVIEIKRGELVPENAEWIESYEGSVVVRESHREAMSLVQRLEEFMVDVWIVKVEEEK